MRFGGIVLAALLALGACSSDPAPKEPKAQATPVPTVPVPTMPAQAKQDSPEGAAAFVKHYVDVFNYAAATGDVDELRDLYQDCDSCAKYADEFEDIYGRGDRISTQLWAIQNVDLAIESNMTIARAEVVVNEGTSNSRAEYQFLFTLPPKQPLKVRDIEIADK